MIKYTGKQKKNISNDIFNIMSFGYCLQLIHSIKKQHTALNIDFLYIYSHNNDVLNEYHF